MIAAAETNMMVTKIKISVICSVKTKDLYIGPNGDAFIFSTKTKADSYITGSPAGKLLLAMPVRPVSFTELYTKAYAAGAKGVMMDYGTPTQSRHSVEGAHVRPDFYNPTLALLIQRFTHSRDKNDLPAFADAEYLVAVRCTTEITYATLVNSQDSNVFLYLAFRDLMQFTRFNTDGIWSPIKVDFHGLMVICGQHGCMIDPAGARFVLTPHLLQIVQSFGSTSGSRTVN